MRSPNRRVAVLSVVLASATSAHAQVRFSKDIRPILSDRCYVCHGPDHTLRKANLRLDTFELATLERDGEWAIVPGDPTESMVYQKITASDPEDRMPPVGDGRHAITPNEQELIREWIENGAEYEDHWAFVEPVTHELPKVENEKWCKNDIDHFILARIEENGLAPNPPADDATLVRRVFLDLTGLPPTPDELAQFEADTAPHAYERLVDRLLNEEPWQTRHAERMATPWLDLARYADTSGIHMDAGRSIWLWRDWVINAWRDNKPFDEFVIEQLAGDLIPNATDQQKVATGFNRNHVTSDEGGAINDEYLMEYAVDRVNTVGSVFLGLTVGCARCHDHKYDPVSTKEFYSLFAFFNNNTEPGIYNQSGNPYRALEPALQVMTDDIAEQVTVLDEKIARLQEQRATPNPEEASELAAFTDRLHANGNWNWETAKPIEGSGRNGVTFNLLEDHSVLAQGEAPANDEYTIRLAFDTTDNRAILLESLRDPSHPHGRVGRAGNGNAILTEFTAEVVSREDPTQRQPIMLTWAWADVEQNNGDFQIVNTLRESDSRMWAVQSHDVPGDRHAVFTTSAPFGFESGSELIVKLRFDSPYAQHHLGRVRLHVANADDAALARVPPATSSWYIAGPFRPADAATAYTTRYGPEDGPIDFSAAFPEEQKWRHGPGVKEATPVSLATGLGAEYVAREIFVPTARTMSLSLGSDDGVQVYLNDELAFERKINRAVAPDQESITLNLKAGLNTLVCKVINTGGAGGFYHREIPREGELPHDTLLLALPEATHDALTQDRAVVAWRGKFSPHFVAINEQLKNVEAERKAAQTNIPITMVMQERAMPRETFVMTRGQYDQPDKNQKVSRGVPAALGALTVRKEGEAPPNRLDLAKWIMGNENPLTARVTANRFWELLFGRGLVESSEDFGLQGTWPSHPQLLDTLAASFQDGWDTRALLRKIVTSATYRQSSRANIAAREVDPGNELLAWYPRQRLSAEQIRDAALYVGGLLVEKTGGPSVKPYQPEGLWREVAMPSSNTRIFKQDIGDALYRRSLYTYWKRASPPPSMLTFDAPTREFCNTRRLPTNTPLQALVLWNDEQFVEAARTTAVRVLREATTDRDRIDLLFVRITGAPPSAPNVEAVRSAVERFRARYAAAPDDAAEYLKPGATPAPDDIDPSELAAWTLIANAVFSSDAALVKD